MKKKRVLALRLLSIMVVLTMLRSIALFVGPVPVAKAVDTGWLDPSSDAGYGPQNFSNPTNAYQDDALFADGIASSGNPVGQAYYGYVTAIPAGSAIQGIEVETHYWLDGAGQTNTLEVALSSDGTTWTAARTDTSEPMSETAVTFGSGSDLWGRAWSVTDITNLRVRVRGITTLPGNRTFYLDWVGVRVTYNSPPTISDIGDQNTDEDTVVGPIDFTVGDEDTPAASLTVSGESSDTTLVPDANIVFGSGASDADRTVTITPTAELFGSAVITVTVDDGSLTASDTFTLTVNAVNDAPIASDDGYNVDEGGTLTISAPGVLDNDTDVDTSDTLTATLVSDVSNGTLTLNADGSFTYVHDGSETISDSFTYQADDGTVLSNVATVTITINPVNDAPVAIDDDYSVDEDGTLTVPAPGVLDNDTDGDASDTLTAILVSDVSNGTLTLNTDGSFTYVHDGSETISDSFTYQADDGTELSNVATARITISGYHIFLPIVLRNF